MQTQVSTGVKKYFDKETYDNYQGQCEAWYFFYPDSVHRLICHSSSATVIGLHIIPAEGLYHKSLSSIREIMASVEGSGDEFQQTHAVIVDSRYTFVPEALFDASAAKTYLQLIHTPRKLHSVYSERLQERVTVYPLHDLFYNAVRIALPGIVFHHYAGLLATAFSGMHDKKQTQRLYVHTGIQGMDIFHYEGTRLKFHNYFPYESDTDVVYFILSVAEQLNLNPDQREVVLCGSVTSDGSLVSLMKKYIPQVLLLQRPVHLKYPASFREFQEQHYFIELSSQLCGL
jgi:hypothetical protein